MDPRLKDVDQRRLKIIIKVQSKNSLVIYGMMIVADANSGVAWRGSLAGSGVAGNQHRGNGTSSLVSYAGRPERANHQSQFDRLCEDFM